MSFEEELELYDLLELDALGEEDQERADIDLDGTMQDILGAFTILNFIISPATRPWALSLYYIWLKKDPEAIIGITGICRASYTNYGSNGYGTHQIVPGTTSRYPVLPNVPGTYPAQHCTQIR